MLSPASLRVCCLAVMAPALTKADRQAGCLPVVLSESFCVPKTTETFNIKDRISENRLKYSFTCGNNHTVSFKKRPFMQRACWRTQKSGTAFICRYRTSSNVSSKSLLYTGRVRTQREARYKTWQSTKTTTAYAGKIKLKYTMNKNTSNIKNMGLAKANTSLGLQGLKQLKRFSKENQSSGPLNVMDDSLNFSDSADSPVQIQTLITDITNSDSDVSPVDITSCVSNNGRTSSESILNAVADTENVKTVSESVLRNDSELLLTSAGADESEAMDTSNASVILTDLLSSNVESFDSSKISPLNSVSTSPSPVLNRVEGTENVSNQDTGVTDVQVSTSEILQPLANDTVLEAPTQSQTDIPVENNEIPSEPLLSNQMLNPIFTQSIKLPVFNSKYSGSPLKASSLFSFFNSSKILTNASRFSQLSDTPMKCPVIADNRFGTHHLMPVRPEKNVCCSLSSQELETVRSILNGKRAIINSTLNSSVRLLQKVLSSYTKKQLSSLVEHYQRKFQIPCQRPAKHVSAKSHKDLLDMKAELLQSEDVKNMSTAALVSLVRKLESSGNQNRILPPKTGISGNVPDVSESTTLLFDPDDCSDIKRTSGIMLSALRSVLSASDPYLTDLSEEESESESDDEETASETETTENTSASWNYMTQRTKLGSRSTWLLARVHELEFRIKEFTERLNELVKAEGTVCLEEPHSLNSSSILESDETNSPTKQSTVKNSFLPLNGFIDRKDACHIVKSTVSESLLSEHDVGASTDTDTEEETCCRIKPLNLGVFRKRKVVSIPGIHTANQKFPRMSTVNCVCNSQRDLAPCILCTGQYHSTQSVDPDSMALRDRIAILDPHFHPALSTEKDVPLCLHLENILKTDAKYQTVRPPSPEPNTDIDVEQRIMPKYQDIRSHRKLSRYARSLSAKYRNKHHRNTKHLRKHKLVFGKWRRLHNKHTLRARNRFRRHSVVSSGGSSPASPVHSPMSLFDDGLGLENKKKRDDSQFDIDDVILPCNSKSGRLEEIPYKEIVTPSWRNIENEVLLSEETDEDFEVITDSFLIKRHDLLEVEEKEKMKRSALGLNKRTRRNRCDSRADSSGANTPDPTSLFNNQDNVFQIPNFNISAGPSSPASPPATPNSAIASDDSQPPFGNNSSIRLEKKKINQKRSAEENIIARNVDFDEVPPYEPLQFPLSDVVYEEFIFESDHNKEEYDMPSNVSSFPASPFSSTSSTSTVDEEDDDETDPEWTVVKTMKSGPELVLKFSKR